jgi:hypothetical protein
MNPVMLWCTTVTVLLLVIVYLLISIPFVDDTEVINLIAKACGMEMLK